MIQIKSLRVSFVCPAAGVISFATNIDRVFDGNAVVTCQACGKRHVVDLLGDDSEKRWSLSLAIASLETELGPIRCFDDLPAGPEVID